MQLAGGEMHKLSLRLSHVINRLGNVRMHQEYSVKQHKPNNPSAVSAQSCTNAVCCVGHKTAQLADACIAQKACR